MGVKQWRDVTGSWWREITSRDYTALKELELEYNKKGCKTWFDMFDQCNGVFALTVMEV